MCGTEKFFYLRVTLFNLYGKLYKEKNNIFINTFSDDYKISKQEKKVCGKTFQSEGVSLMFENSNFMFNEVISVISAAFVTYFFLNVCFIIIQQKT